MTSLNGPPTSASQNADSPVPAAVLSLGRDTGFELYKTQNYPQAEVVARGLVAADGTNWYHHALLAATQQKQGRFSEALEYLDAVLAISPGEHSLRELRQAIADSALRTADRLTSARSPSAAAGTAPTGTVSSVPGRTGHDLPAAQTEFYQQMLLLLIRLAKDRRALSVQVNRQLRV